MAKDLVLDSGADRPTVTIVTRDETGQPTPHPFEVLLIDKPRFDALRQLGKTALPLQKQIEAIEAAGEQPDDEQSAEMERVMVTTIDLQLRSKNGPVTVEQLWRDGLIPMSDLRVIGEHLETLAGGDPPA